MATAIRKTGYYEPEGQNRYRFLAWQLTRVILSPNINLHVFVLHLSIVSFAVRVSMCVCVCACVPDISEL